jgi:hypothetical protein
MNYAFLLSLVVVVVVGLTCACQADDTFAVTRTSIVSLGAEGGDSFSFERISPETREVVVLLRPKGENCTFRFPVGIGEHVLLRTTDNLGEPLLCRASLVSVIDDGTARFSAECTSQAPSNQRECPPGPNSASVLPK